jgi:hypothetical protein
LFEPDLCVVLPSGAARNDDLIIDDGGYKAAITDGQRREAFPRRGRRSDRCLRHDQDSREMGEADL